jgi:hypothetical protein
MEPVQTIAVDARVIVARGALQGFLARVVAIGSDARGEIAAAASALPKRNQIGAGNAPLRRTGASPTDRRTSAAELSSSPSSSSLAAFFFFLERASFLCSPFFETVLHTQ